MSSSSPISVRVAGRTYRVHSSASKADLERYAACVDERLSRLPAAQREDPKSLVLVALGLAHELEVSHQELESARASTEQRLRRLLTRIDEALDGCDENGEPLTEVPSHEPASAQEP